MLPAGHPRPQGVLLRWAAYLRCSSCSFAQPYALKAAILHVSQCASLHNDSRPSAFPRGRDACTAQSVALAHSGALHTPVQLTPRWCHAAEKLFTKCVSSFQSVRSRACAGKSTSWRLPQREIKDLGTCMRRVARVLWALHVILQEVSFHTLSFSVSTSCHPAGASLVHLHHLHVYRMASLLQLAAAWTLTTCITCEDASRGSLHLVVELA